VVVWRAEGALKAACGAPAWPGDVQGSRARRNACDRQARSPVPRRTFCLACKSLASSLSPPTCPRRTRWSSLAAARARGVRLRASGAALRPRRIAPSPPAPSSPTPTPALRDLAPIIACVDPDGSLSLNELARRLNAEGLPTPRSGTGWTAARVARLKAGWPADAWVACSGEITRTKPLQQNRLHRPPRHASRPRPRRRPTQGMKGIANRARSIGARGWGALSPQNSPKRERAGLLQRP
jgi:hypothetical protein